MLEGNGMPFNCKYAIFDNDGTLMESMYYWQLGALEYIIAHRQWQTRQATTN